MSDALQPEPHHYLIVAAHVEAARRVAWHLRVPSSQWKYAGDSRSLRGYKHPRHRLVVEVRWMTTRTYFVNDEISEAIRRWEHWYPNTIRYVNLDQELREEEP